MTGIRVLGYLEFVTFQTDLSFQTVVVPVAVEVEQEGPAIVLMVHEKILVLGLGTEIIGKGEKD